MLFGVKDSAPPQLHIIPPRGQTTAPLSSLPAYLPACLLACSEAACLDPQARMLLEHTQELLASPASAGAVPAVGSSIGVYVGCMYTGGKQACWQQRQACGLPVRKGKKEKTCQPA